MTDRLEVDSVGLAAGGARGVEIADALAVEPGDASGGQQPSQSGVAILQAALGDMRARQSDRVGSHSSAMQSAAGAYVDTDGHAADGLTRSM